MFNFCISMILFIFKVTVRRTHWIKSENIEESYFFPKYSMAASLYDPVYTVRKTHIGSHPAICVCTL